MRKTKRCRKCKETKSISGFYKSAASKDGLQSWCKECATANRALWQKEHREKVRASSARWAKEHPEQRRAYSARWAKEHPEQCRAYSARWYKEHPDYNARWAKEHPEQCRAYCARRRTLKRNLPATLTIKEWQRTIIECGNMCVYCDIPFTDKLKPHQAHFLALTEGGGYTKENILPACWLCNSRVGNRVFKDLHEARKYLKKE